MRKWCESGAKVVRKSCEIGAKEVRKWCESGAKVVRKWGETVPMWGGRPQWYGIGPELSAAVLRIGLGKLCGAKVVRISAKK